MNKKEAIRSLRKKLQQGSPCVGSWMQIPNTSIAEILGKAGYDWITIDLEHGNISSESLPDLMRAIELGDTLPLVRLSSNSLSECKTVMDAGSSGVIVPMVTNAKQLQEIKEAISWPPAGTRGVGFSRANLFGKEFADYKEFAQNPLLIAQIEHVNTLNNLEEILSVSGLDAIIIGPYDLSASMGITGDFEHPDFQGAIEKILKLSKEKNIPCGEHITSPEPDIIKEKIDEGYSFFAYCTDGIFLFSHSHSPMSKDK